jgi:hypothetical protein
LFLNGKTFCTRRTSGGPQSRSVHCAPWPRSGSALAGAWRAAATEGGSSPQEHLEEEGAKGILTTASVGDGATWIGRVSAVRSGDAWSSLRQP